MQSRVTRLLAATVANGGLRRRQPRHGDAEGGAAHVVEPELVTELDGPGLAAVLAADADLETGLGGFSLLHAYLDQPAIYLIEEPENGIHPQAVETVFQALSSAYEAQILCATHSPVILSLAEPEQVLCFARTEDGATDIVRGSDHPNLKDWQRGTDLGTLFATGVLG